MKLNPTALAVMLVMTTGLMACGHTATPSPVAAGAPGGSSDILSAMIRFYQGPLNHFSAVRRGECPMVPSCAEYARQAIAAHGPLIGWVMASDRLMRCGRDEMADAPQVLVNGERKYYDPVEANDFWWHRPSAAGSEPASGKPGASLTSSFISLTANDKLRIDPAGLKPSRRPVTQAPPPATP